MDIMEDYKDVTRIAVVGGGTAAWTTAAMISHNNPSIHVTVIDKEIGTPIGVGEGTILTFSKLMENCGFKFDEWFWDFDATFKSGIFFKGWGKDNTDVWHPFMFPGILSAKTTQLDLWSKFQHYDLKEYALAFYDTSINHNKVDKSILSFYAYHVDAAKMVAFMQKKLEQRENVSIIRSDVISVQRDENHYIKKLICKNGNEIDADLYVDCTGFLQLLKHEPQRVNLDDRLFVNTAVVSQVPYQDKSTEMTPYAFSNQTDHGWMWIIPTQSRLGSGMVFNRNITDIEEAKRYFTDQWQGRVDIDKVRVINWDPYYNKNIWHENVISIGLSAGFVEPLESTGIALILAGAEQLNFAVSGRFWSSANREYYNFVMTNYFEDTIDFVNMHYHYSTRPTKFWGYVRNNIKKSKMQEFYERQMTRGDTRLPDNGKGFIFNAPNWFCWLLQLGCPMAPSNDGVDLKRSEKEFLYHYDYEKSRHIRSDPHLQYILELKKNKRTFL